MHPSCGNEGFTMVVVEKIPNDLHVMAVRGEEQNPRVTNEKTIKIYADNESRVERFGKDGRYPKREQHPSREWWKNHILSPT